MKKIPIKNKSAQPMKMEMVPTQPTKTSPFIPKILQKITNKILWIIILQTRHQ